jgi:hypothetical protein
MAFFYNPKEKKVYKVIDVLDHGYPELGVKNPSIYVETRPGYTRRFSALRTKGVHEDSDIKKYNDNIFKAINAFKKGK